MKAISVVGISVAGLLAMVSLVAYGQMGIAAATDGQKAESVVDTNGNLRVPADYRTAYQSLGTWAVVADNGQGSKEIHTVYASPGTIAAYRKDGRFPDGSVLVKEVFHAVTGTMTTGNVSYAQTLTGWFVMVKDSQDSYPGNRLWGDGWGWSWFDAADPLRTTSSDYRVDCLGCHEPAKNSDWIYVDGYPPLKQ